MKSNILKCEAKKLRDEGNTYKEISAKLNITLFSARKMCTYEPKKTAKVGPKSKITSKLNLRIKRAISTLQAKHEKINSPKLIEMTDANVSLRTLQRHLRNMQFKYKRASGIITLTKEHKEKRVCAVCQWIGDQHSWETTIFSDEKRFSLDGPDDWRTYVQKSQKVIRWNRQCGGASVMIWLMVMPNGLLTYRVVEGNLNAEKYIDLLRISAVPIMKLNYGDDFFFQEDNSPVHKARKVQNFLISSGIKVLQWPAKSPDLNIAEDIWKMMSDAVYDGPQFTNKASLLQKIDVVINTINATKRNLIKNLYAGIRSRLCKVLIRKGGLCNK